MTQIQINEMLHEMVETKCNEGFDRMKNMPVCEKFYTDMAKQGFEKQAEVFKSIVFYTTVLHPEWSDMEIFTNFAKEQGII